MLGDGDLGAHETVFSFLRMFEVFQNRVKAKIMCKVSLLPPLGLGSPAQGGNNGLCGQVLTCSNSSASGPPHGGGAIMTPLCR